MKPYNAPSISIITVVKDDLLGLRQTAKSITHQSCNPTEWIILDGESGPEMTKFLESLSKFSYVQVSTAPPKGIYNAMNRATLAASGEWLWFINAGDVLLNEEVVEILRTNIPSSSNIGIIATPVIQTTPSGFFYSFTKPDLQRNAENFEANFHHQGCLIKRDEFIQSGGYDERLKLAADGKLLDLIANRSQVMILDIPLVVFQLGGRSWKELRKTLEEIDTYRISRQSHFRRNFIVFKNSLRLFVLPMRPRFLIKRYLAYRQQVMFEKNSWGIVSVSVDTHLEKRPRFEKLLCVGQTSHER
jgi:glycosyltransferase involved in cell wall biosynthesis